METTQLLLHSARQVPADVLASGGVTQRALHCTEVQIPPSSLPPEETRAVALCTYLPVLLNNDLVSLRLCSKNETNYRPHEMPLPSSQCPAEAAQRSTQDKQGWVRIPVLRCFQIKHYSLCSTAGQSGNIFMPLQNHT